MDEATFERRARERDDPWTRLVWGLTLLAVGTIFYLDRRGTIDAHDYMRWWPLILVAMGIAHLPRKRWGGAIFLIVLGILFLPELPFLPNFHLGTIIGLWPLLITAGGVSLIVQALRPAAKDLAGNGSFRSFVWMGGTGRTINSQEFVGGDVIAIMGGCDINCANAEIQSEAVIDVMAFWGGIEIKVPPHWVVENRMTAILGGAHIRGVNPASGNGPRLVLRGSAIMGGVEVRNPKESAS